MNINQLNTKYPWTTHPIVQVYAEFFSEEQWDSFNEASVGDLIAEHRITDECLVDLFCGAYIFLNDEEKCSVLKDGTHTFLELVQHLLEDKMMPEPGAFSATEGLLSRGVDKIVLENYLAVTIRPEAMMECSSLKAENLLEGIIGMAQLLNSDETPENKIKAIDEYWNMQSDVFMLERYRNVHSTPSDMVSYLEHLNYEDYRNYRNSGTSALFKPNPTEADYNSFKQVLGAVANFFEQSRALLTPTAARVSTI